MIEERSHHAAVCMWNKMFVIGGYKTTNCEVLDSCSRKFTTIHTSLNKPAIVGRYFEAFCIGNSIVVLHHFTYELTESTVYLYDVKEQKWSYIDCDCTKNLYGPKFLKYYKQ